MTVALWDVAQVTAVADAIRAKTGETGTMTVAQMPEKIAAITTDAPEVWRECWLEKPKGSPTTLFIDTGITSNFEHKLIVKCRSAAAQMSAPFNACPSSGARYGINFLPSSNKLQVYWGNYADTNLTVERGTLDVVQEMNVTQTKSGITINGFTSGGNATTWSNTYTATTASGEVTYKLFTYARNTSIHYGLFRRAEIRNAADETLFVIVPEINNRFEARLKITEGDATSYVAIPAGFVCHIDNDAAA